MTIDDLQNEITSNSEKVIDGLMRLLSLWKD